MAEIKKPDVPQKVPPAALKKNDDLLMAFIREKGRVTSMEAAKALKVSRPTAYRRLNALVKLGVLKIEGRTKGREYVLKSL